MNILFLHFPIDNNQIESKTLPDFFATKGHNVYSCFEKGKRNFYSRHLGKSKIKSFSDRAHLLNIDFDLIVCKNDSFQKYGRKFKKHKTVIVNVTPMGLKSNYQNCDHYFKENDLIKAPISEMQDIFENEYREWKDRKKQIIVPASIGSDKNQREIVDLIDKTMFSGYHIFFAGKIYNQDYANYLKFVLAQKSIGSTFKLLTREALAKEFLNSRLTMLTTDPRPAQPFDPGPRVIFESICAGTPCLINDLVMVNSYCAPFCIVYNNGNSASFNSACREYFQADNSLLSKKCYEIGKKHINIKYACNDAYKGIMKLV